MKTTPASVASPVPTQIAAVNFHGHTLTVITGPSGEHLVAMKPICEAIGLQWEAQLKRIKRHPVLSTCMSMMDMQMPGDDQQREITCLPLDMLNGWLFGVDAARVRPEIRDTLIQYQRECFAVLAAYWQRGDISADLRHEPVRNNYGLVDDVIRATIHGRARHLPDTMRRSAISRLWLEVRREFEVGRGSDIPAERLGEVCAFVASIPLEGELLPNPGRLPGFSVVLDERSTQEAFLVLHHLAYVERDIGKLIQLQQVTASNWLGIPLEHIRVSLMMAKSLKARNHQIEKNYWAMMDRLS